VAASPAFAAIMVLLAAPVWVGLYRLPLRRPVGLAVCSIGFDCVIRTVLLMLLLRYVQPDEWSLDPGQLVKGVFFFGGVVCVLIGDDDPDGD
jgi:hypothetical protein